MSQLLYNPSVHVLETFVLIKNTIVLSRFSFVRANKNFDKFDGHGHK